MTTGSFSKAFLLVSLLMMDWRWTRLIFALLCSCDCDCVCLFSAGLPRVSSIRLIPFGWFVGSVPAALYLIIMTTKNECGNFELGWGCRCRRLCRFVVDGETVAAEKCFLVQQKLCTLCFVWKKTEKDKQNLTKRIPHTTLELRSSQQSFETHTITTLLHNNNNNNNCIFERWQPTATTTRTTTKRQRRRRAILWNRQRWPQQQQLHNTHNRQQQQHLQ